MVLHFKIDQANHLRLLYSASIRIASDSKNDAHMIKTPVNLGVPFKSYH
eukprot:gene51183-43674_t